ncbi:MAG TPA: glycoside hydrolase family 38 C-terminal domain-containing protein [Candidatus Tumulicola sp.]|nr:glycoside hydrolase family 38 C-terminal domain-containing protein [Candidatus Tumulicola sp.]
MDLRLRNRDGAVAVLTGRLPAMPGGGRLRYRTMNGALARLDGAVAGAFDREHHELELPGSRLERELTLEVELRGLPTNGLPAGAGPYWWLMQRLAALPPPHRAALEPAEAEGPPPPAPADPLPLWGHSHLDVAWLWSFDATRRKAMRTFANAVSSIRRDPTFVFTQSQPQLYEYVRETDPVFFDGVRAYVANGRFDASIAALWVEPDCNLPSGESLLRQMAFARTFCLEALGIEPSIAWLPDSFGFARTLPTLLAHAGIEFFATTKLSWNDTSPFAHPQFRWRGPDGAEVVAACLDSMDRGCDAPRVRIARSRREPLVVGYGDGGGGPTAAQLREARLVGRWESPAAWFARLAAAREALPVHDDELYLQYHRGVYTTHHDVKAANAAFERRLARAEERAAWCVAIGAPPESLARIAAALRDAWKIVLRNQFHDVLPGTAVRQVYADAARDYARAQVLLETANAATSAILPRTAATHREAPGRPPVERDGTFEFDNGLVRARVTPSGEIAALWTGTGDDLVERANALTIYRDRPQKWEAWNLDAGYETSAKPVRARTARIAGGGLDLTFDAGERSHGTMRLTLADGAPFLRVDAAVDWRDRRSILRVENRLRLSSGDAVFGAPHGTVTRGARADTPERRAQYEVPGQRFAMVRDAATGGGLALLALDTYGWSARALDDGGFALGHSLLRGTEWPDPQADVGEQQLSWAFLPLRPGTTVGGIERGWEAFAAEPAVRLFVPDDDAVLVVACKPAGDGDGAVVRLRECDGTARALRVRCGGRMRDVLAVDGLERPVAGDVRIDGEAFVSTIGAYGLRSFRVRFGAS